jgi:hypothetical protein
MHRITEQIRPGTLLHRKLSFMGLSLASAMVLAQSVEHLNPDASFDARQTDKIIDSAGQWRQPEPVENPWRSSTPDNSVDDRRFHFGADSAYEEMQYQSDDRFRTKGSVYDEYRPSSLFRYNF